MRYFFLLGHLHVFNPAIVSYFPFSAYSAETGGSSSHALQDILSFESFYVDFVKIKSRIKGNEASVTQRSWQSTNALFEGDARAIFMYYMKHRVAAASAEKGTDTVGDPGLYDPIVKSDRVSRCSQAFDVE